MKEIKVCPECGHRFRGNGWDGIDAHWRSKHSQIMSYEEAWPLLQDGRYVADRPPSPSAVEEVEKVVVIVERETPDAAKA